MLETIKQIWGFIEEYMPIIVWAVAWTLYFTAVIMVTNKRKSRKIKGSWSETYSKKFKTK